MNEKGFNVDVFTDSPYSGNPAGVVIFKEMQDDTRMLSIAKELKLSETAFIQKEENCFNLRWFTPNVEVKFCGHATLASAHVLDEIGVVEKDKRFCFQPVVVT